MVMHTVSSGMGSQRPTILGSLCSHRTLYAYHQPLLYFSKSNAFVSLQLFPEVDCRCSEMEMVQHQSLVHGGAQQACALNECTVGAAEGLPVGGGNHSGSCYNSCR